MKNIPDRKVSPRRARSPREGGACPSCGSVLAEKRGALLSGKEIRALRQHFGLTQAELARLLCLGADTVLGWECGRNVQTAAMDILLRPIRYSTLTNLRVSAYRPATSR